MSVSHAHFYSFWIIFTFQCSVSDVPDIISEFREIIILNNQIEHPEQQNHIPGKIHLNAIPLTILPIIARSLLAYQYLQRKLKISHEVFHRFIPNLLIDFPFIHRKITHKSYPHSVYSLWIIFSIFYFSSFLIPFKSIPLSIHILCIISIVFHSKDVNNPFYPFVSTSIHKLSTGQKYLYTKLYTYSHKTEYTLHCLAIKFLL